MTSAMRTCLRVSVSAIVCAGCLGCRKAPPPPPPPTPAPTKAPSPEVTSQEPGPASPALEPDPGAREPQRPEIPDHPVRGQIDGRDFEAVRVTHLDATVLIQGVDGRAVTLAVFGSTGPIEILNEPTFGAPHVYVRSPHDAPARGYVSGYRLIYDEARGQLWLRLPEDRGTITGRFTVE